MTAPDGRILSTNPDLVLQFVSLASDASDSLADTSARIASTNPGAPLFGAFAPGRLGELGRAMHHQLVDALTSQADAAAAHGARYADLAVNLRAMLSNHDDADHWVRRRFLPDDPNGRRP